ncbi:MAG TPA: hypothetical protein VMS00_10055 [Acidimicrobiales bacterium]|nr:hypothetical protein [Acidimicrobiales bacterium]
MHKRENGEVGPAPRHVVGQRLQSRASDQEVLSAVVEHYVNCLASSEKAKEALGALGVDEQTAVAFRVGYSDRSLGPALPVRQLKKGGELRSQLTRLGLYRPSGHEHFVGCLVVPVTNGEGEVVGLCGRRLDRGAGDLWADGLPGGWFNGPPTLPPEVLLAAESSWRSPSSGRDATTSWRSDVPGPSRATMPKLWRAGECATWSCSGQGLSRLSRSGLGARASP